MRFRLTAVSTFFAAFMGAFVAHAYHPEGGQRGSLTVGEKVPDFSITTLDGKSVKLSDLRIDKAKSAKGVVLLSFWCTSCHSCRHVDKHLAELAKTYAGKAIVFALDANVDDTPREIEAMLKKTGLALPVAIDLNGKAADVFDITRTTTTVIIDGDGVLRYCGQFKQKDGPSAEDALKAVLAGNEVTVKTTPHKG